MSESDRNRRKYFRFRYPRNDRPSLNLGHPFAVTEISEGGLRVARAARDLWLLDGRVRGEVRFGDGESTVIEGHVRRVSASEVVIELTSGVDFRRMLKEQSRVQRRYRIEPLGSTAAHTSRAGQQ